MNIADEIDKLRKLHESGSLSDQEFESAKQQLLENDHPPRKETDVPTWVLALHLSQFAGFILFGAGFIAPIVIWQVKKEEPVIDEHGKIVVNWLLSALIYGVICVPLCFVLIGFVGLAALGVLAIVFPIIGGIKGHRGELWPYPLSIRFFR